MTDHVERCCCGEGRPVESPRRDEPSRSRVSSLVESTGWIATSAGLLFMPKCPLCLAGYMAVLTGVSIPYTQAMWLRTGLIVFCAASLAFLIACRLFSLPISGLFRTTQRKNHHVHHPTSSHR